MSIQVDADLCMESVSPYNSFTEKDQRSRPSLSQDCATCRRRRIKCDRTPDKCFKCTKRGFICPGYGPRMHWVNDVATRGRLKGLQAAVLEGRPRLALQDTSLDSNSNHQDNSQGQIQDDQTKEKEFDEFDEPGLPHEFYQADWEKLKTYYRDHVARLMPWIDTAENPYQTQVVALSDRAPVLRLAISTISALHWNATRQEEHFALPEGTGEDAVLSITASVKAIIDSTTRMDLEMAQWMLASMMVLSCCEMIKMGAVVADWHRIAARALVNVIRTMEWRNDELLIFLINQLAAYDVLSCTTSFDLADIQAAILPTAQEHGSLFSQTLCLIHDITLVSRQDPASTRGQDTMERTPGNIQHDVEIARGETLMAAGSVRFYNQSDRRDFIRLVDLFCSATLMYAHRARGYGTAASNSRLVDDFFCMLGKIERPECICQNLAWPLFIAGVEVRGTSARQEHIVAMYDKIYSATGFGHFRELTKFLESFWSGPSDDWLTCAQQWNTSGNRILAV